MIELSNARSFQLLSPDKVEILHDCNRADRTRCGMTAAAIIALNPFHQPHLKSYFDEDDFLRNLITDLQNTEERLFYFETEECFFTRNQTKRWFPGHSFVIQKIVTDRSPSFQLFQSYVNEYTLFDFLSKDRSEYTYENFDSLYQKVIKPLYSLPFEKFPWDQQDCLTLGKITKVRMTHLAGFTPESDSFFFHPFRTVAN